ncbi:hypothetical protein F2Q69_00042666 [Brassica cretica]|uniref:Uncharacterized protein n=1 Tax=Brassica cretica TaxID=69181 RepID=A0A8S9NLR7_BRACR|nr:hypothetical protein F2Q69_00042666 [Brassica cretica]
MDTFRHGDTLQLAQTFSVSALSIDDETFTSIDRDAMISIDYAVYMPIDPRDRGIILDLLIADSTKDTKVDQPVNYSHLLRLFEGTKADLQH